MPDSNHNQTNINPSNENFFSNELKRQSLKEPNFKSKLFFNKPLTIFHILEPKGFDRRDYYKANEFDEWDAQVWNIPTVNRGKCREYYMDYTQCVTYIDAHVNFFNFAWNKYGRYCWKQYENYSNCIEEFGHHHPEYYIKGSKIEHH